MYKRYGNKFMCFPPPVMLATFIIEFSLALYTLFRYKLNRVSRLSVLMLFFLGLFQFTEYMICGGLGLGHVEWAKLGYVSITLLPALGIHLAVAVARGKAYPLLAAAYATSAAFIYYFVTNADSVISNVCTANYAVFDMQGTALLLYGIYYYGWLLVGVATAMYYARKNTKIAEPLRWLALGYASFIIPTSLANILIPETLRAIPSVMCGFAVILALIIAFRVLPLSNAADKKPVKSTKNKAKTRKK